MVPGGRRYAKGDVRPSAKPLSGRYLSLAEREDIALLLVQCPSSTLAALHSPLAFPGFLGGDSFGD